MSRPIRRILIAGLGVAGPTLAWRLADAGFEPVVVERAPEPRAGGYMIDFWGLGYEVAERLGVLPALRERGYLIDEIRLMREDGRRITQVSGQAVRDAMGQRFFSLPRGELAHGLYEALPKAVEVRFGDEVDALRDHGDAVEVTFASGRAEPFDLAIGADGVHSALRRGVLGEGLEVPLGYWVAAIRIPDYPHRDPGTYVSFTKVGRQIARYALRDGATSCLFVFRAPKDVDRPPEDPAEQTAWLKRIYAGDGWEWPQILDHEPAWRDLYFDSVTQVRAPRWSAGRVALVGDAAYCPSLLAGEGASFAMAGAYVLAGELARTPDDPTRAFAAYEGMLRRFITRKQDGARWMGSWFAPKTRLGLMVRNGLTRLADRPPFGRLFLGDMLRDDFELPQYP